MANNPQQEKRYRSMQEHIRRAHPDYYIPKLPATEESFQLMITTPPSKRPQQPQPPLPPQRRSICMFGNGTRDMPVLNTSTDSSDDPFAADLTGFGPSLPVEAQPPATANAAVALAQLHDWPSDFVSHGKRVLRRTEDL
jgi:hypothetical protein